MFHSLRISLMVLLRIKQFKFYQKEYDLKKHLLIKDQNLLDFQIFKKNLM